MRMALTVAALAFLASDSGARAEVIEDPATGLQFELPAGWKTRSKAGQLVAEPADGKAYLSFAVIEASAIEGYVAKWAEGMKGRLTDLQIDVDDEQSEVNGLQQVYSVGSATLEGKPIQWDLTIVKGGKKVLAVLALGENLDDAVVQHVYASIRRVEPGRPRMKGQDRGTNAPIADDGFDTPEDAGGPDPEQEPAGEELPPF